MQPIIISIPYLRQPEFLSAWNLTEDFLGYIEECTEYMKEKTRKTKKDPDAPERYSVVEPGFPLLCTQEMERVLEVMKNAIINNVGRNHDVAVLRRAFHQFIDECDSRRNTSFLTTFPEMADFYYFCKNNYP